MNRNTIIAIVLSVAIMLGWNGWYYWRYKDTIEANKIKEAQKKEAEQNAAPVATPVTAEAGKTADAKPADISAALTQKSATVAKTVLVDTGVAKIALSSVGGTITSLKLTHYTDDNGNPTELVDAKAPYSPLSLEFATADATKRINTALFATDAPAEITLSPENKTASVAFGLRLENGVAITKKITFHHGSYAADLDMAMRMPAAEVTGSTFGLVWAGLAGDDGSYSYIGPVVLVDGKRLAEEPGEKETKTYEGNVVWGGVTNKYFGVALIPSAGKSKITTSWIHEKGYAASLQLASGAANHLSLYVGPKDHGILKNAGSELIRMINYGWFDILATPLFSLLLMLNSFIGNFGWAIIFLTVLVKLLFWPLTQSSMKSVEAMRKVQPQMKMLQERYKNDKAKMNEELIALYRKYKINPMAGCLPIILQMPVFVALYKVLLESIELKGAPFMFWIHDLSMKDPYYVSPIVMGLSMFVQQKLSPQSADPIQKNLMLIMPVVFTVMFINFPSGLVIYWLVNNLLSILQQWLLMKKKQEV